MACVNSGLALTLQTLMCFMRFGATLSPDTGVEHFLLYGLVHGLCFLPVTKRLFGFDSFPYYSFSRWEGNENSQWSDPASFLIAWRATWGPSLWLLFFTLPLASEAEPTLRVFLAVFICEGDPSSGVKHCLPWTTGQREMTRTYGCE